MKTNVEWEMWFKSMPEMSIADKIRVIRAEAFKAGMTRAANIVRDKSDRSYLASSKISYDHILDDRDALTGNEI